jgi:hypothetical protein
MPNDATPLALYIPFEGLSEAAKAAEMERAPSRARRVPEKSIRKEEGRSPFDIRTGFAIIVIKVCSDSFYANIYLFSLGIARRRKTVAVFSGSRIKRVGRLVL